MLEWWMWVGVRRVNGSEEVDVKWTGGMDAGVGAEWGGSGPGWASAVGPDEARCEEGEPRMEEGCERRRVSERERQVHVKLVDRCLDGRDPTPRYGLR
jgi:hypothetical protein